MGRARRRQRMASASNPEVLNPSGSTNPQPETIEPQTQTKSAGLSSVTKANKQLAVSSPRRSERLKTAVSTSQDKDIERVIDDLTLSENEKNMEPFESEKGKSPEPTLKQKSLEEKVDYLLQQFEEQQRAIEALNLRVGMESSPTGSPEAADRTYRNFYVDSQKKIEALTNENHQLALKLEHALGKLEAYETGASAFSQGLEKLKDMILVTNMTKATETAVNFPSQAITPADAGTRAKSGSKRKKAGASK